MPSSRTEALLELAQQKHVLRAKELAQAGIPRNYLLRLYRRGALERVGRGLYMLRDHDITEHQSLIEAAAQVPRAVICLLSALRFHDLTTQSPFEVWIAIDRKSWKPQVFTPPLRIVRFSGDALTYGVSKYQVGGIALQVYNPAKTIADCFKYRNKIGIDVAIEALRDCYRRKAATIDEIWKAARVCRVSKVIRPYLESLQ